MRERNGTTWALAAALLAAAILSFALVTPWAASAETHAASITALEEKQSTVLELAAASTAASAAITLLPGDAATPIADKLADISGCFLLALCAIYLEKYLLTVTAYAAFRLLVPAACLLLAAWLLAGRDWLRKAGWKLLVFGLAIVLVIPASVKVSGMIEDTYRLSMEETLQQAKDTTAAVEDSAQSGETETDQGFLGGLFSKVTEGISQAARDLTDRVGQMLNRFLEALAVTLVTSCLIPILVLLFFVWLVKFIWGIDLPAPKPLPGRPPRHQERSPQ